MWTRTKLDLATRHMRQRVERYLSLLRRHEPTSVAQGAVVSEEATLTEYTSVARVRDVGDVLWDVQEMRATKHGFSLYFGRPADEDTVCYHGHPRLIVTKALEDYWQAIRAIGHGALFDLPASKQALQRARRQLGLRYHDDVKAFWTERIEDLESLAPRDVAAKYGVRSETAQCWRRRLVGRRIKPVGWWRTPEIRAILLSNKPLGQVSQELKITRHYACELRCRAKQG
jgi:hypothetical protein